jgi:Intracellular proteinase inhibitor
MSNSLGLRWALMAVFVVLPILNLNGEEKSDLLKYGITAAPGNLRMDRMPGPNPPRSYQETFTFVVTNPTRTDFKGSAPTCKTFDVEVVSPDAPSQPIWTWSHGMKFCQLVTPVGIAAGKTWRKTVTWKFTTAEVKDGKYEAIGTFVPTDNRTATVDFEITSVQ